MLHNLQLAVNLPMVQRQPVDLTATSVSKNQKATSAGSGNRISASCSSRTAVWVLATSM